MKSLVAVMCVLAMAAGVALARPVEDVEKELKQARTAHNQLRWHEFHKVVAKYLGENEEMKDLLEKEQEARQKMDDGVREMVERQEEGKALYAKLDKLDEELKAMREAKDPGVGDKQKERNEAGAEVQKYIRENKIANWENEEYRPLVLGWQKAVTARYEKAIELLKQLDDPEAQDFVAQIQAAEEKVKALDAELREAKAAAREE
jgi:hypothetical protein